MPRRFASDEIDPFETSAIAGDQLEIGQGVHQRGVHPKDAHGHRDIVSGRGPARVIGKPVALRQRGTQIRRDLADRKQARSVPIRRHQTSN